MNESTACQNYEKFLAFYNENYQKILSASNCAESNPCQNLYNRLAELKDGVLTPLHGLDWNDSVKANFDDGMKQCENAIASIMDSINSDFVNSESCYIEVRGHLDNLKIKLDEFKIVISNKPSYSSFVNSTMTEEQKDIGESLYKRRINEWNDLLSFISTRCSGYVEMANEKLIELSEINSRTLNISLSISSFQTPGDIASNMVKYSFNGNEYYIVSTDNGYESILHSIGKQPPNKCLHYSGYYINGIFKNSASVPILSSYNALSSPNKSDVLQVMASEIREGRPCIIQVNGKKKGSKYSRHFVAVGGIKEGADMNNLKQSDFLILDPTSAGLKPLDTQMGDFTTRSLLSGQNDTNSHSYDYLVLVYNDPSKYADTSLHSLSNY